MAQNSVALVEEAFLCVVDSQKMSEFINKMAPYKVIPIRLSSAGSQIFIGYEMSKNLTWSKTVGKLSGVKQPRDNDEMTEARDKILEL